MARFDLDRLEREARYAIEHSSSNIPHDEMLMLVHPEQQLALIAAVRAALAVDAPVTRSTRHRELACCHCGVVTDRNGVIWHTPGCPGVALAAALAPFREAAEE